MTDPARHDASWLSADDLHLFNEGRHYRLYDALGAHPCAAGGRAGVRFAVWTPNAEAVSLVGDFNGWSPGATPLRARGSSGIWEGFVEGLRAGTRYKYHVRGPRGFRADKADPYAFAGQVPPETASVVTDLEYAWGDAEWMANRKGRNGLTAPVRPIAKSGMCV